MDRVLFKIITVVFFVMWCMWDKKMIENIKKWVEKCIYDKSKILFEIMRYPNTMFGLPIILLYLHALISCIINTFFNHLFISHTSYQKSATVFFYKIISNNLQSKYCFVSFLVRVIEIVCHFYN